MASPASASSDGIDDVLRLQFRTKIRAMWCALVASIIGVGRLLIDAKDQLPHGQWLTLVKNDLPFGVTVAQRLMVIARDARLTNTAHAPHLPPHWTTLYLLHRLTDSEFQAGLDSGMINSGMDRADAEALIGLQRAKANDAVADEDRELFKASRVPDPVDEARKAYIHLAQKEPTARRGYELWLLFAALGPTALEKFLRQTAKRKNTDDQRVLMAEAIAVLRDDSCTVETGNAT